MVDIALHHDLTQSVVLQSVILYPIYPEMNKYPRVSYLHIDYVCLGDQASPGVVNSAQSAHTTCNITIYCGLI